MFESEMFGNANADLECQIESSPALQTRQIAASPISGKGDEDWYNS